MPISNNNLLPADVTDALTRRIQKELEAAGDKVLQEATENLRRQVRDAVAHIAVEAAKFFTVERMGHEILIKVTLDDRWLKPVITVDKS